MRDSEYPADLIPEYGATEQPAIAARMAPHLRMTYAGAVCAVVAVAAAVAALAVFPFFTDDRTGLGWAIAALVAAVLMLAICVIQVAVWRRAMASWRGQRLQDLHAEARLSWYRAPRVLRGGSARSAGVHGGERRGRLDGRGRRSCWP